MREKTVRYLHKFASIFVSVALVSMFAFPLAVFADPADAPVTDETTAAETAAEETAPAEDAADTDAEAVDTAVEATPAAVGGLVTTGTALTAPSGFSALGVGTTPYTGSLTDDITTFAIDGGLTGHITAGAPGLSPNRTALGEASYYISAPDGTTMTYSYVYNSFSTTALFLFIDFGSGISYIDVSDFDIDAVYTQEAAPGYTAVSFVSPLYPLVAPGGGALPFNLSLQVAVTLTPNPDGTVYHVWEVYSGAGSDTVSISGVYALDTMLNIADDVSVYSLGTNQGMYLEDASGFASVTLPWVTTDGPDDMAAVHWVELVDMYYDPDPTNIYNVFGTGLNVNISNGVASSLGDLLFNSGDSAVYYRYGFQELTAESIRTMTYAVGLGLNPAALPATGDSTSLMFVIAGLGVLAVGATLTTVAVRRRNRKHNSQ